VWRAYGRLEPVLFQGTRARLRDKHRRGLDRRSGHQVTERNLMVSLSSSPMNLMFISLSVQVNLLHTHLVLHLHSTQQHRQRHHADIFIVTMISQVLQQDLLTLLPQAPISPLNLSFQAPFSLPPHPPISTLTPIPLPQSVVVEAFAKTRRGVEMMMQREIHLQVHLIREV
jgi:hypothetical protein